MTPPTEPYYLIIIRGNTRYDDSTSYRVPTDKVTPDELMKLRAGDWDYYWADKFEKKILDYYSNDDAHEGPIAGAFTFL